MIVLDFYLKLCCVLYTACWFIPWFTCILPHD